MLIQSTLFDLDDAAVVIPFHAGDGPNCGTCEFRELNDLRRFGGSVIDCCSARGVAMPAICKAGIKAQVDADVLEIMKHDPTRKKQR